MRGVSSPLLRMTKRTQATPNTLSPHWCRRAEKPNENRSRDLRAPKWPPARAVTDECLGLAVRETVVSPEDRIERVEVDEGGPDWVRAEYFAHLLRDLKVPRHLLACFTYLEE